MKYSLKQTQNRYSKPTLTGKIKLKESIMLSRVDNNGKSPFDSNFIKEAAYYQAVKGEEVDYIKFHYATSVQHKILLMHKGVRYSAAKTTKH